MAKKGPANLRKKAEEKLRQKVGRLKDLSSLDVEHLTHELATHQIELEMQNEELRGTQIELQKSRDKYSHLYDYAPTGYITFDTNGLILETNLTGAKLLGVERRRLINKSFFLFIDDIDQHTFNAHLREVLSKDSLQTCEVRLKRKDRLDFQVQLQSIAVKDKEVDTVHLLTTVSDITERKRIEKSLLESEMRYRSLFENMLDGLAYCKMLYDDHGRPVDFVYLAVNNAFGRLTGLENVIGKKVTEVIPGIKESGPELFDIYGRVAMTGKPEKFACEVKPLAAWFSISVYSTEKGYFTAVFENITERKRAEEALHGALEDSKSLMGETKALLEASEAVLKYPDFKDAARAIFDSCKAVIGASAGYVALLSKDGTKNELLFLDPGGLPCTVDPSLPMPIRGLREKSYRSGKAVYCNDFHASEWIKYLPEGHVDLTNVLFAPMFISGKAVGVLGLAIKPGGFNDNDVRIAGAFGEFAAIALQNSRSLELLRDSEEKLGAANKELEAFSYSVAHDLHAPLRHMSGFVEMLQERIVDHADKKSHQYMDNIAQASKKMGMLIDDLLAFSKIGRTEMKKRKVKLNDLVREIVREIQDELKGRDIVWQIDELPDVIGDQSLLRLVLVNLLPNAVKYTGARPRAEIRIGCKDDGDEFVFFVKDNGVGFNMEYADRLYGVFQRLHSQEEFQGTGIGLANVRRIISRHGGRTSAEGAVGQGATFYFTLPKANQI